MSNRTWVCLNCKKSYRRDSSVGSLPCPKCKANCEYVHWKIHIPSPKNAKRWDAFWRLYRNEKRQIEEFLRDASIKAITLKLLNQSLRR